MTALLTGTILAFGRLPSPPSPAHASTGVRVAFFYRPPLDGTTVQFLASHVQLMILTHSDENYMAELRAAGYNGPILQYVTANETEGPGPYANAKASCDASYPPYARTIADLPRMFCDDIQPHESWFLHNRRGERLWWRYQSGNGVWRTSYEMNPASPGWRRFMIHRLHQYRKLGYDGYFFDNVDLGMAGLLKLPMAGDGIAEFPTASAFRTAVAGYLQAVRAAFPHLPLWANLTHDPELRGGWAPYLNSLDGAMVEDFALGWTGYALPPEERAVQFANIHQALSRGKGIILVEQGTRDQTAANRARLRFGLAGYWALRPARDGADSAGGADTASPRVPAGLYFRYGDAFFKDYRSLDWHRGYDFQPPAAGGVLTATRQRWQRPYAHGVLSLDLANATATVPAAWKKAWHNLW